MVTDKNQALEGLKKGELALAEITIELRNDSEIAVEAIKQYGESAVTFLAATNSLPHTPEVFLTILDDTRTSILKSIDKNLDLGLKNINEENNIDKLMEMHSYLAGDLANIDAGIDKLTVLYKDLQKAPEKGGQEH
ncbi:MAG: DUF4116 domain-containing protein [Clostridiales bacterium]|nr:DUF4116 domain-containing protein [Clostridiales bacterium]